MIIRAKSPLRIGLAGGGTDVSPYADLHGGAILNTCIGMFAHATISPMEDGMVRLISLDRNEVAEHSADAPLPLNGNMDLIKGVCNRISREFCPGRHLSFKLETYVDAPAGSGLGSSSTLVVTILKAFAEWLNLPFGEYDLAHLAYDIERVEMGQAGGRQDQYAAAFGGVNFMEFYADDRVIVNPLKIKDAYLHELELNLVLYYTGTSRFSSAIIETQRSNVINHQKDSIQAMHELKNQAQMMKEALLKGNLSKIGEILNYGWQQKKNMAAGITTPLIDKVYEAALAAGATGGKISGAGGGGFMVFYCPGNMRYAVIDKLKEFNGQTLNVSFTAVGATSWRA